MKRHYATALLATLALAAFGLVSPGSAANAAGPVVSVSIADSAASYITRPLALDPGTQIPAALIPLRIADAEGVAEEITAADPRVSLSTSNAAVVAISDGQLQVLSNGYATVTATVEAASTDLLIWGSGPDKTYLFDDFESTAIGELPSYFNHTRGTVRPSVVETDQGGHQLLLNNPTQEFTTLLVPLPAGIGDYTIEADLTWLNVRDNARWSSLMYRVQGLDRPYYQMAVRQNSTASNGVEFAYRTSSNAWDVRSTQAAPT
ncbi:MAG: hypothetical protein LBG70_04505, partial [Bifidobacteriaceae bacterium]|nr:hypothetical protein [Bifidobacteriaceae bacterium]